MGISLTSIEEKINDNGDKYSDTFLELNEDAFKVLLKSKLVKAIYEQIWCEEDEDETNINLTGFINMVVPYGYEELEKYDEDYITEYYRASEFLNSYKEENSILEEILEYFNDNYDEYDNSEIERHVQELYDLTDEEVEYLLN